MTKKIDYFELDSWHKLAYGYENLAELCNELGEDLTVAELRYVIRCWKEMYR